MVQPLWKTVWQFLTKVNIHTHTIQSSNHFLGIYPKDLKTCVYTEICMHVFIESLSIIAKSWKKPRCPSVGERLIELWYIQTIEY